MSTVLIIVAVLAVAWMLFIAYSYRKMKNAPQVADHPNVKNLTQNNFKQETAGGLVLVDFWAPWCGPCKMVAPVLNEIAGEQQGKVRIGKVNVDNQQALANKFKVRNIPTLILFKNGKEVKRFVGVKPKNVLMEGISEFF
ncbi:MAG: thioredoxin [Prolixibacteraceae bacterium]